MSNKPVDSLEQYPVSIALYERENENGKWLNADVSKTYKDGDQYKKTRNFSMNDMLKLNALVPQAINRMQEIEQQQRQSSPAPSQQSDMDTVKAEAEAHLNAQSQAQSEGQTP